MTAIYALTSNGALERDFELRNQLRGAAISIPANIAEGFERSRPREFHQFLSVAKSSCAEVRTYLYIVNDVGYAETRTILTAAEEVARIIGGLRASVAAKLKTKLRTQDSGLRTQKCSSKT